MLLGKQLRSLASSCLDVSDGLAGDLKHILKASFVGAQIDVSALPYSSELLDYVTKKQAQEYALTGGDDYELCFTAPKSHAAELQQIAQECNVSITKIGHITESANNLLLISNGQTYQLPKGAYEHQF